MTAPDFGKLLKGLRLKMDEVSVPDVEEYLEKLEAERTKAEAELEKYHSFNIVAHAGGSDLENVYNSIKALEERIDGNLSRKESLRKTLSETT